MVDKTRSPNETKNSTDTDETVMTRLGDGDDLALNVLMERWEKPLIGFVTRYTSSTSDALDLAQETFIRVYKNRKRFRAKGKFSTWMFTIAVNLCRNHARWKSRHPTVALVSEDGDDLTEKLEGNADAPDTESMRSDEAELVRQAVQELPHDLRSAVLLFEFQGLSHAEIASVLSCSIKTVEMRLYRARKLLRAILSGILSSSPTKT
ncbi:MAG: RNA polymerase sigma factor (sigma-70 family) [Verrucomicrobiales bacterium]|jgi:RNA polymerase sigma factor (sigma-70 family)